MNKDIVVVVDREGYQEVSAILESVDHEGDRRSALGTPEKVYLICNAAFPPVHGDSAKFTVVDNRDHEAWVEDFDTLDGALAYAIDLKTTAEGQGEWDLQGKFFELVYEELGGLSSAELDNLRQHCCGFDFRTLLAGEIGTVCAKFKINGQPDVMNNIGSRITAKGAQKLVCPLIEKIANPRDGYIKDFADPHSPYKVTFRYISDVYTLAVNVSFRT